MSTMHERWFLDRQRNILKVREQVRDVQLCQWVHDAGRSLNVDRVYPQCFPGVDWVVTRTALELAKEGGLIAVWRVFANHDYYRLTDAGRHLLMTKKTGDSARATMAELEAEMAGAA